GNAIGILRMRSAVLAHGRGDVTVSRDRAGEDKAVHFVAHACIDQVDAAKDVVRIIELANEVRQTLGRVSSQVIHISEFVFFEETAYQRGVGNTALDKLDAGREVRRKTSR